jgi:hypothetical protein
MSFEHVIDYGQYAHKDNLAALYDVLHKMHPNGIDAMHLFALTDGKEAWYGIEIDKKKYRIALEDETEDSVYLKIIKREKE